jgi:hypothetical protein
MLIMVDDERMPLEARRDAEMRMVRFRTLGCYPLTGAIESDAATLEEIVAEMLVARTSERQGRLIDHDEAARWRRRSARAISDGAQSPPDEPAFADFLAARSGKGLLRFLTCGSVDDGKSTLIGRLLYDSKRLFEDQLAALEGDSASTAPTGDDIDFALLVDGLEAEREQGITIDVAYRYLRHRPAQVHRRRHARPRAVHAQHGDRRLDLRPRRAGVDARRAS